MSTKAVPTDYKTYEQQQDKEFLLRLLRALEQNPDLAAKLKIVLRGSA